jgi:hypothetical protein
MCWQAQDAFGDQITLYSLFVKPSFGEFAVVLYSDTNCADAIGTTGTVPTAGLCCYSGVESQVTFQSFNFQFVS